MFLIIFIILLFQSCSGLWIRLSCIHFKGQDWEICKMWQVAEHAAVWPQIHVTCSWWNVFLSVIRPFFSDYCNHHRYIKVYIQFGGHDSKDLCVMLLFLLLYMDVKSACVLISPNISMNSDWNHLRVFSPTISFAKEAGFTLSFQIIARFHLPGQHHNVLLDANNLSLRI